MRHQFTITHKGAVRNFLSLPLALAEIGAANYDIAVLYTEVWPWLDNSGVTIWADRYYMVSPDTRRLIGSPRGYDNPDFMPRNDQSLVMTGREYVNNLYKGGRIEHYGEWADGDFAFTLYYGINKLRGNRKDLPSTHE
jgi:hypothetical protein